MSARRPYVRPVQGWWRRNPYYVKYMAMELTSVIVGIYGVLLRRPVAIESGRISIRGMACGHRLTAIDRVTVLDADRDDLSRVHMVESVAENHAAAPYERQAGAGCSAVFRRMACHARGVAYRFHHRRSEEHTSELQSH